MNDGHAYNPFKNPKISVSNVDALRTITPKK